MGKGLFLVPDATKDERFKNNPLVTKNPKIRFYAGAPLVAPSGHALGTLCVLDKVPRTLSREQQKLLGVLAHHIMSQLELRQHAQKLAEANKSQEQLKRELAQAKAEAEQLRKKLAKFQKAALPVGPKTAARARR
jgi:GAF domain-containing protein